MAQQKTALITGATSGIGKAIARKLADDNYQLIITGRRQDRLEELKQELGKKNTPEILPLAFDVRDHEAVKKHVQEIPDHLSPVDVLVNNAGLAAGLAGIHEGDVENWEQMIDTNIKGLLYMTRQITPGMVEQQSGHVVNIGSLAGKEMYEKGNVYSATKHAVDALNKGMRLDLVQHGIKVTNVNPGLVETEFSLVRFNWDEERASKVYQGYQPLTAEDVADSVWFAVSRPSHVTINDITLTPAAQGHSTYVVKDE